MNKILVILVLLIPFFMFSDLAYIDSLSREMSVDSLFDILDKLSGEEPYPSGYVSWNRFAVLEGADSAADYLRDKLVTYGLDSIFYQIYTDTIKDIYADIYGDSIYTSQNVVAYKRGKYYSDTCVIIGAHYDCSSTPESDITTKSPGVDDNGTGTAAIIEISRIMAGIDIDYDVYLVCFSAEEIGLHGSTKFLSEFIQTNNLYVKFMINLDMIGFSKGGNTTNYYYKYHAGNIYSEIFIDSLTSNSSLSVSRTLADDLPYADAGFRTVGLIEHDFSYYPGYHNSIDSVSYIDSTYYYENTRAAFGLMYYTANSPSLVRNLTAEDNGDSTVTINWSQNREDDINHYTLYYKLGSHTLNSKTDTISSDSVSYTLTGLEIDSTYAVSMTATDTSGYESFSTEAVYVVPTYRPHAPCSLTVSSDSTKIYINYPDVESADISHYNIYRRRTTGTYSAIASTTDTFYTDSTVTDTFLYYYTVTSVDTDSLESENSQEIAVRLIKLSNYLLVLDETAHTSLITDAHCDAYYDSIFSDYTHTLTDCDSIEEIGINLLGNYARVLVIDDDLSESKLNLGAAEDYIDNGGRFMLLGWNAGKVLTGTSDNPAILDSSYTGWRSFKIDTYRYNSDMDMDYMYYDIRGADTVYFSESKLPRGSNGNLSYSGVFSLDSGTEYGWYHSSAGDSVFDGRPVMYTTQDSSVIVVNLPLFCTENSDGRTLISDALSLWELSAGVGGKRHPNRQIKMNTLQSGDIGMTLNGFDGQTVHYSIIDILGRHVTGGRIDVKDSNERIKLDIGLNSGIYFIEVKSGNLSENMKIIMME